MSYYFQLCISLISSIALLTLPSFLAEIKAEEIPIQTVRKQNNNSFQIGEVKKRFQGHFCGSLMPNDSNKILLLRDPSNEMLAWININGKDLQITKISEQYLDNRRRWVTKFQAQNIFVTIDAEIISTVDGEIISSESIDRVTFSRGSYSKTITTNGECSA